MAIDSRQKRMSAMNPASPWRGPMVDATEAGFDLGNRQAANFLYSGILALVPIPPVPIQFLTKLGTFQFQTELN